MLRYVLRRLLIAPGVLLVLITLSFVIIHAPEGDPFGSEKEIDPLVRAALEQRYGLDEAVPVQWARYVRRLLPHTRPAVPPAVAFTVGERPGGFAPELLAAEQLGIDFRTVTYGPDADGDGDGEKEILRIDHQARIELADGRVAVIAVDGESRQRLDLRAPFVTALTADGEPATRWVWTDLGPSMQRPGETVLGIIERYLGPSLYLGTIAMLIALLAGITAGTVAAMRRNGIFDYAATSTAMLGLSVPTFVVGPLLILVFQLRLGWVDIPTGATYLDGWRVLLPACTLALPFAARISRLTRAGLLEVVHQDFVRTARAKGLASARIVLVHILRGGLLPVVGFLGPAIAAILTGSLVVEKIFQIPGLGRDFVESALQRDYFVVLGTVVLYGSFVILANIASDILGAVLDPRVRYD